MLALIVSAVVTPDATLFTMLLMAVPLMVLYELGIWGAKLFGQRKTNPADASPARPMSGMPIGTAGHRVR
jgi:sec-independent protein translocase protein TatC